MQQLTIGKNQDGQRLDKFLKKAFPNAGTGFLYKMLRKKNIIRQSARAKSYRRVPWRVIYIKRKVPIP